VPTTFAKADLWRVGALPVAPPTLLAPARMFGCLWWSRRTNAPIVTSSWVRQCDYTKSKMGENGMHPRYTTGESIRIVENDAELSSNAVHTGQSARYMRHAKCHHHLMQAHHGGGHLHFPKQKRERKREREDKQQEESRKQMATRSKGNASSHQSPPIASTWRKSAWLL
jgi:hypothetical protein